MGPELGCIRADELQAYLLGDLPRPRAQAVALHLRTCAACEATVSRLEGQTDALVASLRRYLGPAPAADLPPDNTVDIRPGRAQQRAAAPAVDSQRCPTLDLASPVSVDGKPLPRFVAGYEVLGELGRGGMSVVYKARQARPARLVALKVILGGIHAAVDRRARFLAEADAIARVQHPNIIQIYEVGMEADVPYFSMELVEGGSLSDRLAGMPQPPDQAAGLVETLARAVHYAHERGVVHRDLKPGNVLLSAACGLALASSDEASAKPQAARAALDAAEPKITDFGLALLVQQAEQPRLTVTGTVLGTPEYMAPEQAQGKSKEVGPAADVYALGALLYECLTGRPPFRAGSPLDTLRQVMSDEPVPPTRLNPQVPRDLETICLKCLQKEPGRRYGSAAELAEDLQRYATREPIRARPVSAWERAAKWARRKPTVAALIGTGVFAVVAAAAGGWSFGLYKLQEATTQRLLRERVERRSEFNGLWHEGQQAEHAGRFSDAVRAYVRARESLDADEEELRTQVEQRCRVVDHQLAEQAARQRVQSAAQAFLRNDHFEVLFNEISPTGSDQPSKRARVLELAPAALRRFGLEADLPPHKAARVLLAGQGRFESPAQLARVAEGCYEVLLAWAEAEAGTGRARQALARLEVAEALGRAHGLEVPRAFHVRRARYRARMGDRAGAEADARLAAGTRPRTALDHFLTGLDCWGQGNVSACAAACAQALVRRPDHFWAQCLRALCSLRSGRWETAQALFSGCIARRPDFLWARLQRGTACIELGKGEWPVAEDDLATVLARSKSPVLRYAALVNRGVLRLRQDRPAAALADLREAIGQAQQARIASHEAYVNLARVYERRQDWKAATGVLGQALQQRELPALYLARARAWQKLDELKAARRDLEAFVARAPRGSDSRLLRAALVELGDLKYRSGEPLAALVEYDKALRLADDDLLALMQKARALLGLGRDREAGEVLDRYLRKDRSSANVFVARAQTHVKLGDHAAALDAYSAALGLNPDAATHCERGWAYLRVGAARLALADFEKALAGGRQMERALCGRGLAYLGLGLVERAVADAEEGARLGDGPETRLLAACVYAGAAESAGKSAPGRSGPGSALRYRERAVVLLELALRRVPQERRALFWRARVENERALAPLRDSARYRQMEATFKR
jgi:serine/threonine protein kinase/Tfp pilus assembly protein PilF